MLLATTTDKLDLVSSSAATLHCEVEYAEMDVALLPGNAVRAIDVQTTTITTGATTDILAAPSNANYRRKARHVNIRNDHTTLSNDVTVRLNRNGTIITLFKVTLRAQEVLEYVEGVGWFVVVLPTTATVRTRKLGADQSNSTTTPTNVSGLDEPTGIGTFHFRYLVAYQAAATTTGVKFSVNHTGTVTVFVYDIWYMTADIAGAVGNADQDVVLTTGGLTTGHAARAKGTGGLGSTTGVDTANADMLAVIDGLCVVTVSGDIELWHGSEVAAQSTVKAGSSLVLIRTGD